MNHTIEDSKFKGLEICFATLQNDPKNKYSKYAIFNGKDRNAKLEIGIEPGMVITTKTIMSQTLEEELKLKILEKQKDRKTEKQLKKQRDNDPVME